MDRWFFAVCFCLLFFGSNLGVHAQQAKSPGQSHADAIAALVAKPLYDLDREQIRSVVENYVALDVAISGVRVTEDLENETFLSIYRDEVGNLVIGEPLPDRISSAPVFSADVSYQSGAIGKVDLYIIDQLPLDLTQEELNWLAENPEITVGVEEWYPFVRRGEDGTVDGIAGDFLDLVLQRTGLRARVIPDIWANLLEDFERGEIDLLPATYFTDERATFGLYSQPYFSGREFIYVREDNRDVTSMADLAGRRLAITRGFGTIPKIRAAFPEIELVLTDSILDSLYTVLNGDADATFEQQIVMETLLVRELISGMKAIPQSAFEASELFFFSDINKPILNTILSKALASIDREEKKQILARWLSSSSVVSQGSTQKAPTEEDEQVPILIKMSVASLVLLAILFGSIYLLGRVGRKNNLSELFGSKAFRTGVLIGLSVLVATVAVMNWIAIQQTKQRAAETIERELQIILNISIDRIGAWANDRKSFLRQWGRDPGLVDVTKKIIQVTADGNPVERAGVLNRARGFFASTLSVNSEDFFVVSPDGVTLLSRNDGEVGSKNLIARLNPESFDNAFSGAATFVPPIPLERLASVAHLGNQLRPGSMFFLVPIVADDGAVVAVYGERVRAEGTLSANLRLSRVGASGETYAVNVDGKMITESRFKSDLIGLGFKIHSDTGLADIDVREPGGNMTTGFVPTRPISEQPFTTMMAGVLRLRGNDQGYRFSDARSPENTVHPSNVEGYSDYRGVQVVGAWTWLPDLGFGLTSELDHEEAYADYFEFRQNIVLISVIATILAVSTTLFTLLLGQRSHRDLMRARDVLEDRVEERTQELQESETRVRSVIENAADGIVVIDKQGSVLTFSPAAEKIFGYASDEILGQNVSVLMPDVIGQEHDSYLGQYSESEPSRIVGATREAVGLRKNGEEFPIDLAISEMNISDELYFTGIIRDISERKEAELRLKDAYEVISGSIDYASHIQRSILPHPDTFSTVFADHFVIWEPRDRVSGDIYWNRIWGDGVLVILGDCTGHGVPGAFMTLIATGALDRAIEEVEPGDVGSLIQRMHQFVQLSLDQHTTSGPSDDGLELGACYLNAEMTEISYSGARFSLFVVQPNGTEEVKGTKKGIGYRSIPYDQRYKASKLQIEAEHTYFMTTDGFIDQVGGERRRMFGKKRFIRTLDELRPLRLDEQKAQLMKEFETYKGEEERRDDVSLIAFRI
ncbi:MAG: PAS domain S-box protein [Magnetovibrionaceae bacterium]